MVVHSTSLFVNHKSLGIPKLVSLRRVARCRPKDLETGSGCWYLFAKEWLGVAIKMFMKCLGHCLTMTMTMTIMYRVPLWLQTLYLQDGCSGPYCCEISDSISAFSL